MYEQIKEFYSNKRILITGAAGTIGGEIAMQLLAFNLSELRLMDNNETGVFFLMERLKNANCFLGDIRDRDKMEKLSSNVDIIIHCAAFKHVILSEYNPFDVVQTNILGVENIIRAATANKVSHVLSVSSDKAVNPTNVMGASKLMGEKLITAANASRDTRDTIFSSVRFGNVIGSRGSVVPIFITQIQNGGPITITDKRMTRFVLTIEDAVKLVLMSIPLARGGEIFVSKMLPIRIIDLAEVMLEIIAEKYNYSLSDIELIECGAKPGEKLYEELLSSEEAQRSLELRDMFVITPAFKSIYMPIKYEYHGTVSESIGKSYVSSTQDILDKGKLKQYLVQKKALEQFFKTVH